MICEVAIAVKIHRTRGEDAGVNPVPTRHSTKQVGTKTEIIFP